MGEVTHAGTGLASTSDNMISLSVPEISGNEWKYLKECLDTGWVSSAGPFVDRFEREVATYLGARHAVATVNGTAALHVALLATGIGADDEVLLPSLTFIAPANAIRYAGAWPVFMDVEPLHWQMDPEKTVHFLEKCCRWRGGALYNAVSGRRVKAILPIHLLGHPVDADPIVEVARRYNLIVVEDATESLGAKYKDVFVGCLGDLACFSFNGNKIITSGGGGMIVTNNEGLARRARYLTTQARDHATEYVHHEIGYNYRLTNVQAALGVAQLERLPEYVRIKRRIAARYGDGLSGCDGIRLPVEAPWATSTYWLYTVLIDAPAGVDREELRQALLRGRVEARPLWAPINEQLPYRSCQAYALEVAPRLYRQALSLPSSVGLDEESQRRVIRA